MYTGIIAYYEYVSHSGDGLATFVGVMGKIAGVIALSTASSIVFLEGLAMLSERYLKRRFEEGKEEGRAEGEARMSKAWEDWLKRRMAAEEAGDEFNEPPPSSGNGK